MFEQSPVGSQVGEETCRYAGRRLFQSEGTGCAEALVQEDLWCAQGWVTGRRELRELGGPHYVRPEGQAKEFGFCQ